MNMTQSWIALSFSHSDLGTSLRGPTDSWAFITCTEAPAGVRLQPQPCSRGCSVPAACTWMRNLGPWFWQHAAHFCWAGRIATDDALACYDGVGVACFAT